MSNADDVPLPIAGWHEPTGATDPRDMSLPLYGATLGRCLLGLVPYLGSLLQLVVGLLRSNAEGARFDRNGAGGSGLPGF